MAKLRFGVLLILALSAAASAEPQVVCLTNNDPSGPNVQLPGACYRMLWSGTIQPYVPGDPRQRDWVPFTTGNLTNRNTDSKLGMDNPWMKRNRFTGYSWGHDDWSIEIDLGQVCQITAFELFGTHEWFEFKVFYPKAGRWLPLARDKSKVSLSKLATRRIRIEMTGVEGPSYKTYSEFRIWGNPLGEEAEEKLPAPPPPHGDKQLEPMERIRLKPATVATRAPDPFVFPNPVEMTFGEERVTLPLGTKLVLADATDAELKQIAEYWITLANRLYHWDVELALDDRADSNEPKLYLGLADQSGPCAALGKKYNIAPGQIKAEGYALQVSDKGVVMVGIDHDGAQWAMRSLLFLLKPEVGGGVTSPHGHIRDYPRSHYRFAFGYPSWLGEFKAGLLQAVGAVKTNQTPTKLYPMCKALAERERWYSTYSAEMFPGSVAGVDGDKLEMTPRGKRNELDISRLSACPLHTDFWPNTIGMFPTTPARKRDVWVGVGYDELLDNPFVICARCRSLGISQRDMLGDTVMKAYHTLIPRGFKMQIFATGYEKVSPAFDFFEDIPTENVLVFNYNRPDVNRKLADLGFTVIAGSDGRMVPIGKDSAITSGIMWNWGPGTRASMMSRYVPLVLMQAEENWSALDRKFKINSPQWVARKNRIVDFARKIIDYEPFEPEGTTHEYFTVDLSQHTNRTLTDDIYADGKGFLDEGPSRDLRYLPVGKQTMDNVPFDVTDRAIIVTGEGSADTAFPKRIANIPVNRKVGQFVFLQACSRFVWQSLGRQVVLVGSYRLRYDDDTVVSMQLNYSQHLREWDRHFGYREMEAEPISEPCPGANVAWRGSTAGGDDVTLYSMRWRNPYPQKTVKSIDVIGSGISETSANHLILLAITGRAVEPLDERIAASYPFKPKPRPYHEQKPLPPNVVVMDLTRNSPPPPDTFVSPHGCTHFQTRDKWVTATCSTPMWIKSELSFGAYSAIHPDDDPLRFAHSRTDIPVGKGAIEVTLKQAVPLHAIGIKTLLQTIKRPLKQPATFYASVLQADLTWRRLGQVKDWLSIEGEYRYVFDEPIEALGVKIVLLKADGLSSVRLYVPEGAVPDARFEGGPALLTPSKAKDDKSLEELLDDVEGF